MIGAMVRPTRTWVWLVAALALAPLVGCGGGDDREDEQAQRPVDGTFVGKVSGSDALVAVVASPPARGEDRRDVEVYVSDGRELNVLLTGTVERNRFTATSEDRDAEAEGELARSGARGTVELPGGRSSRYQATRATAASGLYDLTVERDGGLAGASAAGVGLTSVSELQAPGSGRLAFADGRRLRFVVTTSQERDPARFRAGSVRLIVLPDGEMGGAGEARPARGGDEIELFIRSSKR
jgi:hypothetical protein